MSGRILPVALATVVGVSIGVATFDGEFKEQRRKRLEEEYRLEVAAQSALAGQSVTPMASNAISSPSPQSVSAPLVSKEEEAKASSSSSTSSWSSMLGFWAWKKDAKREATPAAAKPTHDPVVEGQGKS